MRFNFRMKLFVAFALVALMVSSAISTVFYLRAAGLPTALARDLLSTAVADAVDELNPQEITSLAAEKDPRASPLYEKLRQQLQALDDKPPHFSKTLKAKRGYDRDIYVLVRTESEGTGRLLVTINPGETNRLYEMTRFPAMMRGWTELSAEETLSADEYGKTLSAFAPIRDHTGKTIALLGMDAPAVAIEEFQNRSFTSAAAVFAGATLFSLALAAFCAWRLNRPIRMLHESIDRVAAGHFDVPLPALKSKDEFEPLFAHFNRMIAELRDREEMIKSLALARHIQMHLLPKTPPVVPGYQLSAAAEFCDQTGGDFFDFIELPGAAGPNWGIAIADVTGHGIAAALLMTASREILRSNVALHADLSTLLGAVNKRLYNDTDESHFVTLLYAVLEPHTRTLRWASAGHEPLLWYKAQSGTVEAFDALGIPLGIDPEEKFPIGPALVLGAGDIVLLSTDGAREARNHENELFGLERLCEVLVRHAGRSARDLHKEITKALETFRAGCASQDDLTLVIVKVE